VFELGRSVAAEQRVGESVQMADHAWREIGHERKELVANPHAKVAAIGIRRVGCEGHAVSFEMQEDVGASSADERPDPRSRTGGKHGEPARTGAAEEAQEHRFGAIVCVVSGCDERRRVRARCLFECGVAHGAGARLEVTPRFESDPRTSERHAEAHCVPLGEVELLRRLGSQAVVDTVRREVEAELRAEPREHVEKRHRVGTARNRGENALSAFEPAFFRERSRCEREERRRMRARHGRCLSDELEFLAELEVSTHGKVHAGVGLGGVAVAATLVHGLEVRAILASEAEREGSRLVAQTLVDQRLH
jgi:hypothetical protein